MDIEAVADAGKESPTAVRETVYAALAEAIEAVGPERVAAATDLDEPTVIAIVEGDRPPLTLDEVGAVLAVPDRTMESSRIRADLRDAIIVWMSDAVVDAPTLAEDLEDMTARTLREKIEGERRMSVEEYARVVATLHEDRMPR